MKRRIVAGAAVAAGVVGYASSALAQEDRQDVLGGRHKMYAESLGVSEYFNKPVKLDKLIASAEKLLAPPAVPQP